MHFTFCTASSFACMSNNVLIDVAIMLLGNEQDILDLEESGQAWVGGLGQLSTPESRVILIVSWSASVLLR